MARSRRVLKASKETSEGFPVGSEERFGTFPNGMAEVYKEVLVVVSEPFPGSLTVSECSWCTEQVASQGQTCDQNCYDLWVRWHTHRDPDGARVGNLHLLMSDEVVPLSFEHQNWYLQDI